MTNRLLTRFALTLLMALFINFSFSQEFIWSDAFRNDVDLERVKAVEQSDTFFHVVEVRDDHILRWILFDKKTLRHISTKEISPTSAENTLEHFFISKDTLHTISTRRNRELDRLEVFAMRYTMSGQMVGSEQLVHFSAEAYSTSKSGLRLKISPDGSRVLLYFDKDIERKQTEGIHFKCYDKYWSFIWEKDLRLPPSPDILQVHHFLVDNFGGVYMMSGRNPVKTSSDWQRPQGGQYVVYYFNAERNKLKQYDINLKDKQVISAGFFFNDKQDVVIAGYYSNNFQNKVSGTLLFTLQGQGGPISLAGYTPFPKEFMQDASGRETGSPEDYYLDYIYFTKNGDVILAGEQYYVSRSVSNDPTTGRQLVEYRYNYDDVMVCMMDSTAQLRWSLIVPKHQMSSNLNDPNFSYAFSADTASVALTFNDNETNNDPENHKKRIRTAIWTGGRKSVTTRVEIGFDGRYTRRTLIDNDTERLLFNPLMTTPTPWSRGLLGFDDKRSYKFCRIR